VKTVFRSSFAKDLKSIKDKSLREKVAKLIKLVEAARDLAGISEIKKLQAKGNYYRTKLGEYRVGIAVKGDEVTFVRCLHRKEIYRYFP
jgi:mRNA interferase RelE/StbE